MLSINDTRVLGFATYDAAGALKSSGQVTFWVQRPNGQTSTWVVSPDSEGRYHHDLKLDQHGFWQWTWLARGAPARDNAESGSFMVSSGSQRPGTAWCSAADALKTSSLRKYAEATPPTVDIEQLERSCTAATEYLHSRTYRRFKGLSVVELRPCCQCSWASTRGLGYSWSSWPTWDGWSGPDVVPVVEGAAGCGCSWLHEITLPDDMPDDGIALLDVRIDGEVFTAWRLDPGRKLVRTDGEAWPCCQDLTLADSEVDTFSVHVVLGEEAFELARMAATELAVELYLSLADPSECRIPTKTTSIVRQGVTYTKVDTTTLGKDGSLGLRVADIFLSEFGKPKRKFSMSSPDVSDGHHRIGDRSGIPG